MRRAPIDPAFVAEIVSAYEATGSERAAAASMGIPRSTYRRHLAAARGVENSPHGFEAVKVSTTVDKDGETRSTSIVARPELGDQHEIPEGHSLKRLSALVDAEGRLIQKWVISTPDGARLDEMLEAIRDALKDIDRVAPTEAPSYTSDDLLTMYPVVDQHHGLYAWAPEAGEDFDVKISEDTLKDQLSRLIALAPASKTAQILGLGDFYHSDGQEAKTTLSSNPLDRDGRQARVTRSGVRLLRWAIDLALTKHEVVHVTMRAGNHDDMSSLWLSECLSIAYELEPRVIVDMDPSPFWYARFGRVMLAATHGHGVKPGDFAACMATECAEAWGATEFRYGFQGHIHHDTLTEKGGATVRTFQTLAAKDAWHAFKGYTAGRSMEAITFHRDCGEVSRLRSPVLRDRAARADRVITL